MMADVVERSSIIALCKAFALNCKSEGHNADGLDRKLYYAGGEAAARSIIEGVKHLKAADVRPVVRCRDCKFSPIGGNDGSDLEWPFNEFDENPCPYKCLDNWYSHKPAPDFFCAAGEKREKKLMEPEIWIKPTGRQKKILDVTCGDRTIWFQKNEPHTIYCDKRREEWEGDFGKALNKDGKQMHRHLVINPDVLCDFTDLPFDNCSFSLVVFDPPHIENLSDGAWTRKAYGSLDGDWKPMIRKGFEECMRVLKPDGVLVFKWSDVSISTREILNVIGQEPLFGHRSGKKMNTHWMCFMKFEGDKV